MSRNRSDSAVPIGHNITSSGELDKGLFAPHQDAKNKIIDDSQSKNNDDLEGIRNNSESCRYFLTRPGGDLRTVGSQIHGQDNVAGPTRNSPYSSADWSILLGHC